MTEIGTPAALDPRTPPIELLGVVGPDAPAGAEPLSEEESLAYCHGLATTHYENFSVLSSLVPKGLRDDFAAVYAFCRWADDLGDETGNTPEARAQSERLLGWWRGELDACFGDGPTRHPVFVALRRTRMRHRFLGPRPFHDLIDAFVQDQRVTRYRTWDQVLDYCTRSANPVGRIVLTLAGHAPPEHDPRSALLYAKSDATCTALQLINFWQDVRRDLVERDRIYVPEMGPDGPTGITPEMLREWLEQGDDPRARVPYIRGVRRLVDRTELLFAEGRDLPELIDPGVAPVVWLFGAGGEAILSAVRGMGCATLWGRPRLSRVEKGMLVARAWWRSVRGGSGRQGRQSGAG